MPIYFLVREVIDPANGQRIGALVPAGPADRSSMRELGLRRNVRVRAVLSRPRNARFNRLVHGMGRLLAENIDRFQGKRAHEAIKALQVEAGVCCTLVDFELPGVGTLAFKEPQSLSFDSMSEEIFQDFWRRLCVWLIEKDWPDLSEEKITQMAEFEAFGEMA